MWDAFKNKVEASCVCSSEVCVITTTLPISFRLMFPVVMMASATHCECIFMYGKLDTTLSCSYPLGVACGRWFDGGWFWIKSQVICVHAFVGPYLRSLFSIAVARYALVCSVPWAWGLFPAFHVFVPLVCPLLLLWWPSASRANVSSL